MWYSIYFIGVIFAVSVNGILDIEIKKYEPCDSSKTYEIQHHAKFTKINSTHMLADGGTNLLWPIDNQTIALDIKRFVDNEWKSVVAVKKPGLCSLLGQYGGKLFFAIEERAGIKPNECPIPKGNYEVKDILLNFAMLPIQKAAPGPLKAVAQIYHDDKEALCYNIEAEIVGVVE